MQLKNSKTGKVFSLPDDPNAKSMYRLELACWGLDRLARLFGMQLYFLTLTLNGDNVDKLNGDLNKFLNFMRARFRRAGLRWYYVWVVELQKKRYYESGVLALHWHFAIICPDGSLPDVYFDAAAKRKYRVLEQGGVITTMELYESWGYGQVYCTRAWSRGVYGYLSKYFTKDYGSLADFNPEWSNLRRFSASQMGYFKYPQWAFGRVKDLLMERPVLRSCVVRREPGRICFYRHEEPGCYVLEYSESSPWELIRVATGGVS